METLKALRIKVVIDGITYEGFIQEVKEAAETTPITSDQDRYNQNLTKA